MALIQWKQIDPNLSGSVNLTGSLGVSGSMEVTGDLLVNGTSIENISSGIFNQTGSVYATTNDLEVTGSFDVLLDNTKEFKIFSGSFESVKITSEGTLQLGTFNNTPSALAGALFYSSSGELYVGLE